MTTRLLRPVPGRSSFPMAGSFPTNPERDRNLRSWAMMAKKQALRRLKSASSPFCLMLQLQLCAEAEHGQLAGRRPNDLRTILHRAQFRYLCSPKLDVVTCRQAATDIAS